MKPDKLICGTANITYDKGYIALWCTEDSFPETLDFEGVKFLKKSAFHVSLMCVKNILRTHPDLEDRTLQLFCEFQKGCTLSIRCFTDELRLVTDEDRGRKSIISMCVVENLDTLRIYIEEELGISIDAQPTHVTLYTLEENMGIGVNSFVELTEKSEVIEIPELLECVRSLN